MAKSPEEMAAAMIANMKEKSGSFNAMVSHRARLENARDVDKDVKA